MYIIKDHFNFKFTIEGGNLQVMQKKDNKQGIIDSSLGLICKDLANYYYLFTYMTEEIGKLEKNAT